MAQGVGVQRVELHVAAWIPEFCKGMLLETEAWVREHPGADVNHEFILRTVQQFVTQFGIRVTPC